MRRLLTGLVLGLCSTSALAVVQIADLDSIDLGTWDPGQGSLQQSDDFCVRSTFFGTNLWPYAIRANQPLAGAPYELISLSNPGDTIPLTLTHVDATNGAEEALTHNVFSAADKTPVAGCPGPLNARFRVDVAATDLASAMAGQYRASFNVTVAGGFFWLEQTNDTFDVDLIIPDLIRISGLDDIALGSFDGANDLTGSDDLCVYRNDAVATYTVTATGNGPASAFEIASGANTLPYQVGYDDGTGFVPLPLAVPVARSNANSSQDDCGGGTNATVQVTTLAADMLGAPPGTYTGTLTLTVAPL